ncbi:MAG: VCBS repeat-containing protein [Planctomycetales bacterium]|nr:VCBS repeat-containing protein [Planctomycetales bacterium]
MADRKANHRRQIGFQSLESRCLLAGNGSVSHYVDAAELERTLELFAFDVDNDGDSDLITSGLQITWKENLGVNSGEFARSRPIGNSTNFARVVAIDLDSDGDKDLLFTETESPAKTTVFWVENLDNGAAFSNPYRVIEVEGKRRLTIDDIDEDGRFDEVVLSERGNSWELEFSTASRVANLRALEDTFVPRFHTVVHDMNGDSIDDAMVGASIYRIDWHPALGIRGSESDVIPVVGVQVDFDRDGDLDLVSSTSVLLNDGSGKFTKTAAIPSTDFCEIADSFSLGVFDVNADGSLDVVSKCFTGGGDNFVGAEVALNQNGRFVVGTSVVSAHNLASVFADFNGDGMTDLIYSENPNDHRLFFRDALGDARPITSELANATFRLKDLDGDGDLDVIVRSRLEQRVWRNDPYIAWYENLGQNEFGPRQTVVSIGSVIVEFSFLNGDIGDLDGDGLIDAVVLDDAGDLTWHRSRTGEDVELHLLAQQTAGTVVLHDHDKDGDQDIVLIDRDVVRMFRNTGNAEGFEEIELARSPNVSQQLEWVLLTDLPEVSGDLDGDGDLDHVSGPGFTVHETRPIGDANGDGRFDSSDLVAVFQAGKYNDKIAGNTSFTEGDWNNDGDFDSADLVLAFQSGLYDRGDSPAK